MHTYQRWLFGGMALAVAALTAIPSREADAARLQANIVAFCGQIPQLNAAIDYTLNTWPPDTANVNKAGADTVLRLVYFNVAVTADGVYCGKLSEAGGQVALAGQPDAVLNTLAWHYGMGSAALQEYQRAVGAR